MDKTTARGAQKTAEISRYDENGTMVYETIAVRDPPTVSPVEHKRSLRYLNSTVPYGTDSNGYLVLGISSPIWPHYR
jgi:hypothetical protein